MTRKTVLICGNFRGGTTITTKLVQAAGFHLYDHYPGNYEDKELQRLLHNDHSLEEIKAAIQARTWPLWAFKYPALHQYLPELLSFVTGPHLVCILRDPYAVADSESRKHDGNKDFHAVMKRTVEYNGRMIDLHRAQHCPTLLLSYEHLVRKKTATVKRLLSFLGSSAKVDELVSLIQ